MNLNNHLSEQIYPILWGRVLEEGQKHLIFDEVSSVLTRVHDRNIAKITSHTTYISFINQI